MNKIPAAQSLEPATELTYLAVDPYTDRERLYIQYELFRADFNVWFDRALQLGGLALDATSATWRVLDVGCGEGLFAHEIHTRYPQAEIVGFDRDPQAVATATKAFGRKGNPRFYVHDARDPLPLEFEEGVLGAGAFDVVFAHVVLMHLRDPAGTLAQLHRALKPGGVIYLRDCPTDPLPLPQPGLASLYATAMDALRRTAVANFARQHPVYLKAAGFTALASGSTPYAIGGPTPDGQRMLKNIVSGLQAARAGLVDYLHLIDGDEFDSQLQRCLTESTDAMVGTLEEVNTIARKSAQGADR